MAKNNRCNDDYFSQCYGHFDAQQSPKGWLNSAKRLISNNSDHLVSGQVNSIGLVTHSANLINR